MPIDLPVQPMITFSAPADMRTWADQQRSAGKTIGFVPTMGALHSGHVALIADAAHRADLVVVSIFVNPLQFNESADFDGYPRPIDVDVAVCASAGVAAVFAPTAAAMYPPGFQTRIVPGPLGDVMEGPNRPGHFEGVVTVVAKLLGAVRPHVAIFGQKDYQQLRIITQMAADFELGVEIIGHPIVRDPDGLAQSSRNLRLSTDQRAAAIAVPHSLDAAVRAASATDNVETIVSAAVAVVVEEPLAKHEYTTVFDATTLEEITNLTPAHRSPGGTRIATAVWFGDIRLIDNRELFPSA
jgi:pantoate--beta-alanine ligase